MVTEDFIVSVPTDGGSDRRRLAAEMSRALSVWLHREVAVDADDPTEMSGK